MAASGFTPIQLYRTTTAAAVPVNINLADGELALNTTDEKLYFKNAAGTVKLLASNTTTTNVASITFGTTGLTPATATTGAVTVAGTLAVANGGTGVTSSTGTTNVVLSNSPTLVTPALGTPSALVGTNITGTASSFNINGTVGATTPSTGVFTTVTINGTSSAKALTLPNIAEVDTISATAATGTINYDVTTQSVLFYTTNASGNWTVNFRGSVGTSLDTVMATGESISATFLVTQGATAYYNSVVQIDGSTVTPKWQGGTAPTSGNASSVDCYTYVIQKTGAATYVVLASQTKFA